MAAANAAGQLGLRECLPNLRALERHPETDIVGTSSVLARPGKRDWSLARRTLRLVLPGPGRIVELTRPDAIAAWSCLEESHG